MTFTSTRLIPVTIPETGTVICGKCYSREDFIKKTKKGEYNADARLTPSNARLIGYTQHTIRDKYIVVVKCVRCYTEYRYVITENELAQWLHGMLYPGDWGNWREEDTAPRRFYDITLPSIIQ